jgi:hypothetical protein
MEGESTYTTGLVLPAIATSGTPGAVVGVGALAGMTYQQVAQNTVNYFVNGQIPAGNPEGWVPGGWGYGAYGSGEATRADNSTSQWPVVGMLFANSRMGIPIPASVTAGLAGWVSYIQDPVSGGSMYSAPFDGIPIDAAKTGGMLVEMKMLGLPVGDPNVQKAIAYLNANWQTFANNTWEGNFDHPYAMWSVYKGLETMTGLNSNAIGNLPPVQPMDPGDTWNWWESYTDYLVNTQNVNGTWNGYAYWDGAMANGWYTNILLATQVGPVVPEPLTMAGLLAGIGGLVGYLRRRK